MSHPFKNQILEIIRETKSIPDSEFQNFEMELPHEKWEILRKEAEELGVSVEDLIMAKIIMVVKSFNN